MPRQKQSNQSNGPVWQDPSSYDALVHGPPYMPSMKLASQDRNRVRTAAQEARPLAVEAMNVIARRSKEALLDVPVEMMAEGKAMNYKPLADLLVVYRGVTAVHLTHHWQTRGGHYYADHLLLQRIYEETQALIDPMAERTVGLGHWLLVDAVTQARALADLVGLLTPGGKVPPENMIQTSYNATLFAISAIEMVIKRLDEAGLMTAGLDDLLPAHAGVFEGHGYLLGQRLSAD